MKLLLHTCCGPCFLGTWEDLEDQDLDVTNYFYNPNIYPREEYLKRLEYLMVAAKGKSSRVVEAPYEPGQYAEAIKGEDKNFPGRCALCYRLRLANTAEYAKKNNFEAFSTTLLVSPYQDHVAIKQIGEDVSREYGVEFYYRDWRPYFREGQETAQMKQIYRQKYCGCVYSRDYR